VDADQLLTLIADHLDRLRSRAEHLDRLGLLSGARWLRVEADRLEAEATEPEGVPC
jgi:hypothetical protein